jgi:H+/Cl- antiporter ClcA
MSQQQGAGGEGGEGEEEGISLSDLNVKSPLHDEEEAKKPTDEDATQRLEVRSEHNTWVRDIFQIRSNDEVTESGKKVENTTAPSILLFLFTLGCCAGLINGLILWASSAFSQLQVVSITHGDAQKPGVGLLYFWISSSCCALFAACLCKFVSPFAAGSGLPEFKYLLATEMNESEYNRYLAFRVFVAKVFGLIFSAGSCLSIGSEGPLVHTAACIAFLLMKYVGEFGDILQSPSLVKQVFAASAAVGVSSAFNAPVGGLLFSIEVTSTYYLISNYWKSFIAAVAGSVACNIFLISRGAVSDPLLTLSMKINAHPFYKAELIIFTIMGIALGYAAHYFLKLHQKVHAV